MFVATVIPEDTDTHRYCVDCKEMLHYDDFYKDGRKSDGSVRYRRECKSCYSRKRAVERNMKKNRLAARGRRK